MNSTSNITTSNRNLVDTIILSVLLGIIFFYFFTFHIKNTVICVNLLCFLLLQNIGIFIYVLLVFDISPKNLYYLKYINLLVSETFIFYLIYKLCKYIIEKKKYNNPYTLFKNKEKEITIYPYQDKISVKRYKDGSFLNETIYEQEFIYKKNNVKSYFFPKQLGIYNNIISSNEINPTTINYLISSILKKKGTNIWDILFKDILQEYQDKQRKLYQLYMPHKSDKLISNDYEFSRSSFYSDWLNGAKDLYDMDYYATVIQRNFRKKHNIFLYKNKLIGLFKNKNQTNFNNDLLISRKNRFENIYAEVAVRPKNTEKKSYFEFNSVPDASYSDPDASYTDSSYSDTGSYYSDTDSSYSETGSNSSVNESNISQLSIIEEEDSNEVTSPIPDLADCEKIPDQIMDMEKMKSYINQLPVEKGSERWAINIDENTLVISLRGKNAPKKEDELELSILGDENA